MSDKPIMRAAETINPNHDGSPVSKEQGVATLVINGVSVVPETMTLGAGIPLTDLLVSVRSRDIQDDTCRPGETVHKKVQALTNVGKVVASLSSECFDWLDRLKINEVSAKMRIPLQCYQSHFKTIEMFPMYLLLQLAAYPIEEVPESLHPDLFRIREAILGLLKTLSDDTE